jgi:hypothetical protein
MSEAWGRTVETAGDSSVRIAVTGDRITLSVRSAGNTVLLTARQSAELRQALEQGEAATKLEKPE